MKIFELSNPSTKVILKCDDRGIIIDCSLKPNNRPHWCIGKTIEWLKDYHEKGNTIMIYTIKEIDND